MPVWEPGFVWMARLSEQDKLIKAGGYQAINGDSPWQLLERMARGDMTQRQITFLEGWTFRQIRQGCASIRTSSRPWATSATRN